MANSDVDDLSEIDAFLAWARILVRNGPILSATLKKEGAIAAGSLRKHANSKGSKLR